jgi:D-glycero-D-manno-heptose 1,7-bisphosphate phosphatase
VKRAVFLDRDGVINRAFVRGGKPYPPRTLDEFELLPGVESAIQSLREAGFLVVVVTNQPDVGTGAQKREIVEAMHATLVDRYLCDAIKVCYHTDADGCDCRKPRPGMLLEAAEELYIDLKHSFMVGDRWRDVAAGHAAGCYTFFVDYRYGEARPESPDAVVESLAEATQYILSGTLAVNGPTP